ncbi:transporter substrate-binding domain-containing protein [Pseudoalteromonas sp. SMS1]|uniref:substrate-binding periplasmic protein n=1 Tax=Pseudoalteromonas sp. SMS1 TaxID=2908894 RepID=UPI001F21CFC3|nr:transporter substrate-binding domain-containing protein [Pseudoalteromonas sp. SMS1]MCF2857121.1 transporter substrate-binding domain-containing protein [Pseudoalteromonas sp. SMS1]
MKYPILITLLVGVTLILSRSVAAQTIRFVAEDLPPYHFINEAGKPDGGLVEIARALQKVSGLDAKIEILPMARAHHELQTMNNVVMLAWLKTPSREQGYKFLGTMCKISASLIGLKENKLNLTDLEHAKQYRISTIRGYYSEEYLRSAGFSEDHDLVLVSHYASLWHLLYKGRTDLILTNTQTIQRELDALGLDSSQLEYKLTLEDFPSQLHLAANQNFPDEVARKISAALDTLKVSGRYQEIIQKWQMPH